MHLVENAFHLILVIVYRYIFTFAIGAGPVTGLIIPELSSSRTRGKIMGFSFSVHWVCTRNLDASKLRNKISVATSSFSTSVKTIWWFGIDALFFLLFSFLKGLCWWGGEGGSGIVICESVERDDGKWEFDILSLDLAIPNLPKSFSFLLYLNF